MLWQRNLFAVVLVLTLGSCGFRAVYNQAPASTEVQKHLAAVTVKQGGNERYHQLLRAELERRLERSNQRVAKHYELETVLSRSLSPLGVQQDKQVTRYNLIFTGKVALISTKNNKVLANFAVKGVGSFDAETSDFSTYVAEKDVEQDIMRDMAQDIAIQLTSYFSGRVE